MTTDEQWEGGVLDGAGRLLDQIRLTGITATGYHGVFEFERREGQTFVADVVVHLDTRRAAARDDLTHTLHYGVLAEQVSAVLSGDPVDLVETVAERIAATVLSHAIVQAVDVSVHKPQAPIEVPFGDVVVRIRRDRAKLPAAEPYLPRADAVAPVRHSPTPTATFPVTPAPGSAVVAGVSPEPDLAPPAPATAAGEPVPGPAVPVSGPAVPLSGPAVPPPPVPPVPARVSVVPAVAASAPVAVPPAPVVLPPTVPWSQIVQPIDEDVAPAASPVGTVAAVPTAFEPTGLTPPAATPPPLAPASPTPSPLTPSLLTPSLLTPSLLTPSPQTSSPLTPSAPDPLAPPEAAIAATGAVAFGSTAAGGDALETTGDVARVGSELVETSTDAVVGEIDTDALDATPPTVVDVVLALGANLGAAQDTLRAAVDALSHTTGLEVVQVSPLARTAAVGGPDQPDYLNAVVLARTMLSPRELLRATQAIEQSHGRVRAEHWGPRTLDVDIIVYGSVLAVTDDLELPHPRAHERAFVLEPWAQVDPHAVLPGLGGGPVGALAATAPDRDGIRWLALDWLTAPAPPTTAPDGASDEGAEAPRS